VRTVLCIAAIGLVLAPGWAVADRIALYSDDAGNCNLALAGDISWHFFVFHESTAGATGSSFRISFDWGTGGGSVLFFDSPYADPPYTWAAGQTLDYGVCKTGTFYVATLTITGFTNEPCEAFAYALDALSRNCSGAWQDAMGSTLTIDGDASCPCSTSVTTDAATWGRIKALYR